MQPVTRVVITAAIAVAVTTVSLGTRKSARAAPRVPTVHAEVAESALPEPLLPPWQDEVREVVAAEAAELNTLIALQHQHALPLPPDPPSYSR